MKYYYNNTLIRTSKTHKYTHAVINEVDGKVICYGCSSSKAGAEKIKNTEISYYQRRIANGQNALKALDAGKSGYYYKDGRHTEFIKFEEHDREFYERYLDEAEQAVERYNKWQIVEIEER